MHKNKYKLAINDSEMKSLYLLLTIIIFSFNAHSQCTPSIPSTANVVNTTQLVNGGFTPQWVCTGDTLNSNGGIFSVYLEAGSVMNTGGGSDSIYVKAGATLRMNGGIHTIIFEPLSILNIIGGIATYDTCQAIVYNYTNAPLGGCVVTSIPKETLPNLSFSIAPNPFTDQTSIFFADTQNKTTIVITDILGKEIRTIIFSGNQLDISKNEMTAGIYFVKAIDKNNNVINKKVVLQ